MPTLNKLRRRRSAAGWLVSLVAGCSGPLPVLQPAVQVEARTTLTAPRKPNESSQLRERRPPKVPMIGVLNVNRATEAELRLLPGIGKGRAAAIVARRAKRPFASLNEVARIRGLKSIVRRLRPHLALDGETTLRPRPAPGKATEQAAAAALGAPAG